MEKKMEAESSNISRADLFTGLFLGTVEWQNTTDASLTSLFVYHSFVAEGTVMVLGNFVLISVILGYKALRRKEMYIVAGLAMGDMLYGTGFLFSGIRRSVLAWEGKHMWNVTPWHCMTAIQNPFFIAGSQSAAFMLVALSVDRLLAVRWFAFYKKLGNSYAKRVLLVVFSYSFAIVPVAYFLSAWCTEPIPSVPAICISTQVGPKWFSSYQPTVQMSCGILSVFIYITTWKFYTQHFVSMPIGAQSQQMQNQRKLTRTVGITVLFTFFCYILPHSIIFIFNTFERFKGLAGHVSPYGWVISNINSMANIIILTVHNKDVRLVLKNWAVCKKPHFQGGHAISQSVMAQNFSRAKARLGNPTSRVGPAAPSMPPSKEMRKIGYKHSCVETRNTAF